MEVVLNNSFIYQSIFIEWWGSHYNFENTEEARRYYDEDYLGIEYNSDSWYWKNFKNKRKVINEHKFFLAKIKHGL